MLILYEILHNCANFYFLEKNPDENQKIKDELYVNKAHELKRCCPSLGLFPAEKGA